MDSSLSIQFIHVYKPEKKRKKESLFKSKRKKERNKAGLRVKERKKERKLV